MAKGSPNAILVIVSTIRQKTAISLLGALNVAKRTKRESAKFKELRIDTALIVKHGHMTNYSGCPKFPKPRKGTSTNTNTYTNTVNSIIRQGISYAQATNTSNSQKTQQMVPRDKRNPAVSATNQANQSNLITPPLVNNTSNGSLDLNLITQNLQQTILALSMLTQHPTDQQCSKSRPPPTQPKKSKKEAREKNYTPYLRLLIEDDDD
ncbi:hypothetical protein TNCV_3830771 [Trichonephila clavipes]|nr:hypothetical protein TNCV_3830771 [Trichonephila clavipes]